MWPMLVTASFSDLFELKLSLNRQASIWSDYFWSNYFNAKFHFWRPFNTSLLSPHTDPIPPWIIIRFNASMGWWCDYSNNGNQRQKRYWSTTSEIATQPMELRSSNLNLKKKTFFYWLFLAFIQFCDDKNQFTLDGYQPRRWSTPFNKS